MNIIKRLEKSKSCWFIVIISFAFFFLRWPSLFEPYWYGDEGIYQAVGLLLRSGEPLYSGAFDNKPPLLYLLYALFNSDQFLIRTASLVFGVLSIWVFYFLSKKLFEKGWAGVVATVFYTFFLGTRVIEGNIANAENFMVLPILLSAYLLYNPETFKKSWQRRVFALAGIILSLAFLTKIVAGFDFAAFSFFLLIASGKDLKENLKTKLFPFVIGFLIPIGLTAFYFLLTNNFAPFMQASFFSNIGYVGYGNKFLIPQGLLLIKLGMLAVFLLFLFVKREILKKNALFVLIWLAFSIFNAFFSQRPYTHYLLTLLPSFALMIGLVIAEKRHRFFYLLILVFTFILVYLNFGLKGKIIAHYTNLIEFCTNKKDVSSYQSFFDRNTPRDYALSRYIKSKSFEDEDIFVWGNNAQLYKLAEKTPLFRYTVAYHITGYPTGTAEMQKALEEKKPKYIIIMPNVPDFPLPLDNYEEKVNIKDAVIYEKVL